MFTSRLRQSYRTLSLSRSTVLSTTNPSGRQSSLSLALALSLSLALTCALTCGLLLCPSQPLGGCLQCLMFLLLSCPLLLWHLPNEHACSPKPDTLTRNQKLFPSTPTTRPPPPFVSLLVSSFHQPIMSLLSHPWCFAS